MITVLSWLWSDPARQRSYQFGREEVRIWASMVERNLTVPHRLICVTHLPNLVEDICEVVPLDVTKHVPGTCCVKLMAWHPDAGKWFGDRFLSMDLDCVITGNMDALVQRDEPAVFWRNPNYVKGGRRGYIQGSLQLISAGAHPEIWRDFDPRTTPSMLNRRFGGAEQSWLSERLNTSWPEPGWEWAVPTWDETDGIYGAGRLVGGEMGAGVQSELPENACIVFTPGDRSPSQPEMVAKHKWIAEHYR